MKRKRPLSLSDCLGYSATYLGKIENAARPNKTKSNLKQKSTKFPGTNWLPIQMLAYMEHTLSNGQLLKRLYKLTSDKN